MQPTNKSNDTAQPKPEDITSGPQKSKVPGASDTTIQQKPVPQPEGAPTSFPAITKPEKEEGEEPPKAVDKTVMGDSPAFEQADECADGYHKDADGMCVPDEPLDEQVKRFKAETKEFLAVAESRKMREQMAGIENYWVNKYSKLNEQYIKAAAYSKSQDQISRQLRESVRAEQLRCEDLRVETRDLKNQLADAVSLSSKQARLIEDLKIENATLSSRYNSSLSTNLKLTKDVTRANEDYLELAKVKEKLEDEVKRAKVFAKKTLKLKA